MRRTLSEVATGCHGAPHPTITTFSLDCAPPLLLHPLLPTGFPQMMKQTELYQKVYRGHEMLGWYTIGAEVESVDMAVHREMFKYNESPFFLLMHPSPDPEVGPQPPCERPLGGGGRGRPFRPCL